MKKKILLSMNMNNHNPIRAINQLAKRKSLNQDFKLLINSLKIYFFESIKLYELLVLSGMVYFTTFYYSFKALLNKYSKLYGKLENYPNLVKKRWSAPFLYISYCQCLVYVQEKLQVYQVALKSSITSFTKFCLLLHVEEGDIWSIWYRVFKDTLYDLIKKCN